MRTGNVTTSGGSTQEPSGDDSRAYSMANYPEEKGIILLNIGIAIPPPGSKESVPPGVVSSYLFSLKPGDPVTIAGPYGEFYAKGHRERDGVHRRRHGHGAPSLAHL